MKWLDLHNMNVWRTIWTHLWCCFSFSYQGQEQYSGQSDDQVSRMDGLCFQSTRAGFCLWFSVRSLSSRVLVSDWWKWVPTHSRIHGTHQQEGEHESWKSFSLKIKKEHNGGSRLWASLSLSNGIENVSVMNSQKQKSLSKRILMIKSSTNP